MKTLIAVCAVFVIAGCVAGCGTGGMLDPGAPIALPITKELPPAGQQAQQMIREGHLSIASSAGVVKTYTEGGIWTPDQAQRYLDKLKDARTTLVRAQVLVDRGMFADALNQSRLMQSLLLALQRELAEEVQKAEAAKREGK